MAEGYLRHVAGDHFEATSAGVEPTKLNSLAVEAMSEIGIDISHQKSKNVVTLLGQHIPYVVTVCDNAKERCPIFPRTYKFLYWSFDDGSVNLIWPLLIFSFGSTPSGESTPAARRSEALRRP
jgi:arsenate reductase